MDKSWLYTGGADVVPPPERDSYQLTLKEPDRTGSVKVMIGGIALLTGANG